MQKIDLTGLKCPMPILRLHKAIQSIEVGDSIEAVADDPAFCPDIEAWCRRTQHELVVVTPHDTRCRAVIRRHH